MSNFLCFLMQFPCQIIQNHKIISFKTFWKSLTRLSRLLKVLSWPRLSRLANAILNPKITRFFSIFSKMNLKNRNQINPKTSLVYSPKLVSMLMKVTAPPMKLSIWNFPKVFGRRQNAFRELDILIIYMIYKWRHYHLYSIYYILLII